MSETDKVRAKSVYDHLSEECSDACQERGEKLFLLLATIVYVMLWYSSPKIMFTIVPNN